MTNIIHLNIYNINIDFILHNLIMKAFRKLNIQTNLWFPKVKKSECASRHVNFQI